MTRINIDLESYLKQMNRELDLVQKQIKEQYSEHGKDDLRKWFSKNEIINNYSNLMYSIQLNTYEETCIAIRETLNKFTQTMNLYCSLVVGFEPFRLNDQIRSL